MISRGGPLRRALAFLAVLAALWGTSLLLSRRGAIEASSAALGPVPSTIRVRLGRACGPGPVPLTLSGRWELHDPSGRLLHQGENFEGMLRIDAAGWTLGAWRLNTDRLLVSTLGDGGLRVGSRSYHGRLRLELLRGEDRLPRGIEVYDELPLEDYVVGVVSGELPTRAPGIRAALAAQAVAARSWAVQALAAGRPWLRDDARDQFFESVEAETPAAREAVERTAGLVLCWQGRLLPAYYEADCGGASSNARTLGFTREDWPPLRGVADPDCRRVIGWARTIPPATLDRYATRHALGRFVRELRVLERDPAGRALRVRLLGETGKTVVSGPDLARALSLDSTLWTGFQALPDGGILVHGHGHGHGIGLCQEGAMRRARAGADFRQILAAYYPGAQLLPLRGAQSPHP